MIARIWRGVTHADDVDAYGDYLEKTGLLEYRTTPGNLGAYVLVRIHEDRAEFTVISLWSAHQAIVDFCGDEDIETAIFYPDDEKFLIERDERVSHHEVIYASASSLLM